jgi:hypothetical protein
VSSTVFKQAGQVRRPFARIADGLAFQPFGESTLPTAYTTTPQEQGSLCKLCKPVRSPEPVTRSVLRRFA